MHGSMSSRVTSCVQAAGASCWSAARAFFFSYANRLTRFVVAEYDRERESLLRQSEQRRMFLVREVMAGREVDADASATTCRSITSE
jgi:hypothetical protein